MIIRNWHIDGFGVFRDAFLPEPGLSEGFNLFVGPNEAGKSTLLDFVRYTLFGYPTGNSNLPRRKPLRSGNPGGSITFEHRETCHHVVRRPGRENIQFMSAEGTALDEASFRALTGQVTPEVFRNVFGFSLKELNDDRFLGGEQVKDMLLAASFGGTVRRIVTFQKSLQRRADDIFRPGARDGKAPPTAIALYSQLKEARQTLEAAVQDSRGTVEATNKLAQLANECVKLETQLQQLNDRKIALRNLVAGWDPWVRICEVQRELKSFDDVLEFHDGLMEQWRDLKSHVAAATDRESTLQEQIEALKRELDRTASNFPALPFLSAANALNEKNHVYKSLLIRVQQERASEQAEIGKWEQLSAELGTDWSPDAVLKFDASLKVEDEARRIGTDRERSIKDRERAEEKSKEAASRYLQAWVDVARRAAELRVFEESRPGLVKEHLEVQAAALDRLQSAGNARASLLTRIATAEDHRRQVEALCFKAPDTGRFNPPPWFIQVMAALAVVSLLTVSVIDGPVLGEWKFVCVTIGVMAASTILVFWLQLRSASEETEEPLLLANATDILRGLNDELSRRDREWSQLAAAVGLPWPLDEPGLRDFQRRLGEDFKYLDERERLQRQVRDAKESRRREKDASYRLARELRQARARSRHAESAWRDYLGVSGIHTALEPQSVGRMLQLLRESAQVLSAAASHAHSAARASEDAGALLERVRAFLAESCQTGSPDSEDAWSALRLLIDVANAERTVEEQRGNLLARIEDACRSLEELQAGPRGIAAALRCRDEFLTALSLGSEDELIARRDRFRALRDLRSEERELTAQLKGVFNVSGPPEELLGVWESGESPPWQTELVKIADQESVISSLQARHLAEKGVLEDKIQQASNSSRIAELELEVGILEQELRSTLDEWLDLETQLSILQRTRERFERDNHSPALVEASCLLSKMTAGRYKVVNVDPETNELSVQRFDNERLPASALSRGTLEMLYVCVRLGFIRHYQDSRCVSLPLLMDDIAVNFDAGRMKQLHSAILECCGRGQQILYFTCNEDAPKLLGSAARVFRLKDYQFELVGAGDTSGQASLS